MCETCCNWLVLFLFILISLLTLETDPAMIAQVQHRYDAVQLLRFRWSNPLIAKFRWDAHAKDAANFARRFANIPDDVELIFLPPRVISLNDDNADDRDDDNDDDDDGDHQHDPSADLLADADCLEDVLDESEVQADDPTWEDITEDFDTLIIVDKEDFKEVTGLHLNFRDKGLFLLLA